MCLALGIIHPDYLLVYMSARQLEGWADYNKREPIGFPMEDFRSAMAMHVSASAFGGAHGLKVEDFMLGPSLADTEALEADGTIKQDEMIMRLEKLLPPHRPKEIVGLDGKPIKK